MRQVPAWLSQRQRKTGGVSFEGVDLSDVSKHTEPLEKAIRKLLVGAMPPAGSPRPTG